jgi:hypothetical protein
MSRGLGLSQRSMLQTLAAREVRIAHAFLSED